MSKLDAIRSELRSIIGRKVIVTSDKGRNKIVIKEGTVVDVFPSIFTIKFENEFDIERVVSYTYSDILTSVVELKLC